MTEHELYLRLRNNPDFVEEILTSQDIRCRLAPLGPNLAGMTYRSKRGTYIILVNQMLEYEERQLVFLHELYHILYEFNEGVRLVRLDESQEEQHADEAAVTAYIGREYFF